MTPPATLTPSRLFRSGLLRLLAVSIGLPIVICLVDQLAIEACKSVAELRVGLPLLFVVQVGLLAACAGRFLEHVFLRCVVFAWAIALVDALAMTTLFYGHGMEAQCMMFALLSGQIGLLTIWGMLNRLSWPVRIPILLASLMLFVMIMMNHSGSAPWRNESQVWAVILALQSAIVVGICAVLRYRGYRLAPLSADAGDSANKAHEQFQFSIKHVIFWTTVIAPLLVVAKGIDWLLMGAQELYWSVVLALGMGAVTWIAMVAALGSSRAVLRILILCCGPPLVGLSLRWVTSHWTMTWGMTTFSGLFVELRDFGYGWVLWSALAAWFLSALLLVFRAAGFQLIRVRPAVGG